MTTTAKKKYTKNPSVDNRRKLFVVAWFELGKQCGYYLSDVAFDDLAPDERSRLNAHARDAAWLNLIPQRTKQGWTFVNRKGKSPSV